MEITYKSFKSFSRLKKADKLFILAYFGYADGEMIPTIQKQNPPCVVAFNGDTPVGIVTYVDFNEANEIHTWVADSFKRMGIGTNLVKRMLKVYWRPTGQKVLGAYLNSNAREQFYSQFSQLYDRTEERYG